MLTAIDADVNIKDSFDVERFRIKIWSDGELGSEEVFMTTVVGMAMIMQLLK